VTFTGPTELYVRERGDGWLTRCQIGGRFVEYQPGSFGTVVDNVFDPAELRINSPRVVSSGNSGPGVAGPLPAAPAAPEETQTDGGKTVEATPDLAARSEGADAPQALPAEKADPPA
jgi:hypothetical protein